MADGPERLDRGRSSATRRSSPRPSRWTTCSPTCSASARRWPSSSTSTAASPASSPSRTSSRRSSARSTTRPTRRAARSGAWPTATGSCAATSRSPTCSTTASTLPVDTDAYNSVGGFVFAELGRLPRARRHGHGRRLLDPRRVGAREPHRGGPHPRAARRDHARRRQRPVVRCRASSARGLRCEHSDAANAGGVIARPAPSVGRRSGEQTGGPGWVHRMQTSGPPMAGRSLSVPGLCRGNGGRTCERPAVAGRSCFWEEVHLRGTFARAVSARNPQRALKAAEEIAQARGRRSHAVRSRPPGGGTDPAIGRCSWSTRWNGSASSAARRETRRTSGTGRRRCRRRRTARPSGGRGRRAGPRTRRASGACARPWSCDDVRVGLGPARARRRSRSARPSRRG